MNSIALDFVEKHERALFMRQLPSTIDLQASLLRPLLPKKYSFLYDHQERNEKINSEKLYSLVDTFADLKGYRFTWGYISETLGVDAARREPSTRFDFCFQMNLNDSFEVEELSQNFFDYLSSNENTYPLEFESGKSSLNWFAFHFTAIGKGQEKRLREWVGRKFLVSILPDFLNKYEESTRQNEIKESSN